MPSDQDFITLEEVSSVLEPLCVFTDTLAGEKNVTVSAVHPLLQHILDVLLAVSSDDKPLVKELKRIICDDLHSRYITPDISELIDKCYFLDPRFKSQHLQDKDEVLMLITMEAVEIAEVLKDENNSLESKPPTKKLKGLAALLTKVVRDVSRPDTSSMSPSQKVDREIQAYLEKPVIEANDDPLSWWSSEKAKLLILSELSRKYLCICGTSVSSERL